MIEPLRITTTMDKGQCTVVVVGEVDMATVSDLEDALRDVSNVDVVVDLSGVAFLDSSGIAALAQAHRETTERDHRLTIRGERPTVRRALEITGLFRVLHPEDP